MSKRPKHAVVLITTPPGWIPERVHSLPPVIVAAEFHATHLKLPEAIRTARKFNKAHLPREKFAGQWAMVIKSLRSNPTRDPKLISERRANEVAKIRAEERAAALLGNGGAE